MSLLDVSRISKSFGAVNVLHGVDMTSTAARWWASSATTVPASRR